MQRKQAEIDEEEREWIATDLGLYIPIEMQRGGIDVTGRPRPPIGVYARNDWKYTVRIMPDAFMGVQVSWVSRSSHLSTRRHLTSRRG